MTESAYDEEIAPALLKIAERCKELGMPFVATVEYDPEKRGTTASGIAETNMNMLVPFYAAQCGARLDDLMIAVTRRLKEQRLPHSCICLERFGLPCSPSDR